MRYTMPVTWALFEFSADAGEWNFAGFTPHDEVATEFEEMCAENGIECAVIPLEHPPAHSSPCVAILSLDARELPAAGK